MTPSRRLSVFAFVVISGAAAWVAAGPGTAAQRFVPYQGFLEEGGAPVGPAGTVSKQMTFSLFAAAAGGAALATLPPVAVDVTAGRFAVNIGPVAQAVFDAPDLFLEIAVDGTALLGRQQVLAVPYAFHGDVGKPFVAGDVAVTNTLAVAGTATVNSTVRLGFLDDVQGAHLLWNRSAGGGETNLINHRGLGTGGFTFDDTGPAGNVNRLMTLDRLGNVTAAGTLKGSGGVLFSDGTVQTTAAKALSCSTFSSGAATGAGLLNASVNLPAGFSLTGGGCEEASAGERQLLRSNPSGNSWVCRSVDEDNGVSGTLTAFVIGCKLQ